MASLSKKKTSKAKKIADYKPCDLMFVFKNVRVNCMINQEVFNEEERSRILEIVKTFCKEMTIDKSYVQYKGTKYEKTFIKEDGWDNLCKLVVKTEFGSKCTTAQFDELVVSYGCMIICYLYQILEDFGYDTENICIEIEDGTKFMVEYHIDLIKEWKYYPGKWQTWK